VAPDEVRAIGKALRRMRCPACDHDGLAVSTSPGSNLVAVCPACTAWIKLRARFSRRPVYGGTGYRIVAEIELQ
jgi:hypothetical protein